MIHAKGPLLTIDVGERSTTETNVEDVLESFVGGRGVATALAHHRIPFDADPFGPENRAYFATGPLQVSQTSFTGRTNMTGLSPLTDGLVSTNAGGYVSRNLADTGYSAVEIAGKSDDLLGVHVTDEGVEFEPVTELTEAPVSAVSDYTEDEYGLDAEHVAAIGPAGENRVRFASVMTFDNRAFGRGGLGAVLGSKNVKFVTFAGDSRPEIDLPQDVQREIQQEAAEADDRMKRQGTTGGTEFINDEFSLPTRYFSEYEFEGIDGIKGERVEEKKYKTESCSLCAYGCKLPTRDEETGLETEGPEFETVFSFGSNCAVDDIVAVMKSNDLCDEYGLDTISAGDAVAAYLASEDEFGNVELIHDLVEKIAFRKGIGDTLAEGIDRFHDDLGVENWSVKGLEFAAHDGRVLHGQGLSYAVANRGADHMYAGMLSLEYGGELDSEGLEGKPERLVREENLSAMRDSAVKCAFGGDYLTEERFAELLGTDLDELIEVGGRIVELERHFNNQRGMDRADDRLPYEDALPGFEAAIDEYYAQRGWTDEGVVPDEAIEASGTAD
jgi:aldehyde:ferredoxin oxidoreductase